MVEAGEDLRLPREPGEPIRITGEGVGEDLQRHLAVELRVGGLPDLAHAALAQECGDVVVPEACPRCESHWSVSAVAEPRRVVPYLRPDPDERAERQSSARHAAVA